MKITLHIRIVIVALITNLFCSAQVQTANNGTHEFFANAVVECCDAFGTSKGEPPIAANSGILFNIEYVTNDSSYVIYIFQRNETENIESVSRLTARASAFNKMYNSYDGVSNSVERRYFLLSYDEYNRCAYKLRKPASFVVGAATSIIKIRPGIKETHDEPFPIYFDFGNDFSLGVLFGVKFTKKRPTANSAFNLLCGFGTVALHADSVNTKGFLTTPTNNQGLYGSIGAVFDYQDFQFGLFTGLDWMTGKTGTFWIYRNRPWVGISIGYSIFNTKKPSTIDKND